MFFVVFVVVIVVLISNRKFPWIHVGKRKEGCHKSVSIYTIKFAHILVSNIVHQLTKDKANKALGKEDASLAKAGYIQDEPGGSSDGRKWKSAK